MSTFGEWLTQTRESRGLGVRELARKAGTTHPTISNLEKDIGGLTTDMMRKIASGLDVPYETVLAEWSRSKADNPDGLDLSSNELREIIQALTETPGHLRGIATNQAVAVIKSLNNSAGSVICGGKTQGITEPESLIAAGEQGNPSEESKRDAAAREDRRADAADFLEKNPNRVDPDGMADE